MFTDYQRTPACIAMEVEIFNNFFQILPESWSSDPVKTHLLTKLIHETANDCNNSLYVISKLLVIRKKLCCYVGLTLFWALYPTFLNNDGEEPFKTQKYYKMHGVNKFFKLLPDPTNDKLSNLSSELAFRYLSLISIYVNYILLNDEKEGHDVFQEFFQCNRSDIERFKLWLQNFRCRFSEKNVENFPVSAQISICRSEMYEKCIKNMLIRVSFPIQLIEIIDFNLMAEIENAIDTAEKLEI